MVTLLNEDQARGVDELRQEKRVGVQDVADGGDPRALELLVLLGPELGDAALGLDALVRLGCPDPLQPALLGLAEPGRGVALPKGRVHEQAEGRGQESQSRVSHGRRREGEEA